MHPEYNFLYPQNIIFGQSSKTIYLNLHLKYYYFWKLGRLKFVGNIFEHLKGQKTVRQVPNDHAVKNT